MKIKTLKRMMLVALATEMLLEDKEFRAFVLSCAKAKSTIDEKNEGKKEQE